ncbi:MAG: hypothetical protein LBO66_08475 [Deltaproteobacteria bacterium]|nr:hypothetical protein [Deltaproteobacteria bacterium]
MTIDITKKPVLRALLKEAISAKEDAVTAALVVDLARDNVYAAISTGSPDNALAAVNINLPNGQTALDVLDKLRVISDTAIAISDPDAATIASIYQTTSTVVCASVNNLTSACDIANKFVTDSSLPATESSNTLGYENSEWLGAGCILVIAIIVCFFIWLNKQ